MFTAMLSRPIVWLLATLALLGAGWLAYEPLRQAWQPATDTAGRGPETAPAPVPAAPTAPLPPVPASDDPKSVAEAPAAPPAPAAPETPSAEPAGPVPERRAAEAPAVPPPVAPTERPAVTASRPEAGPAPATVQPDRSTAAPPAPVETTAGLESSPPSPPEAGPGVKARALPRIGELAPAAPAASAPPVTPAAPPAGASVAAAAPEARVAPPRAPVATVIEPSAEARVSGPATPEAKPESRTPPPATVERPTPTPDEVAHEVAPPVAPAVAPQVAPQVAEATPLPSTEPAVPQASPEAAAPSAGSSLSLDSIRRALAALLGGAPEPTDPAAGEIAKPEAKTAAVEPDPPKDLTAPTEPSGSAPALVRPSFDIVRVEPGGRAVIAGRAAPGAEVEVLAGERVIDRTRADGRGEWIAIPAEPLPVGGLELGLRATSDGARAVEAEQIVVVVVPEPPPPQPAAVAAAEGPPPQPAPVAGAEAPPPQPAEVRQVEASAGPLAVLLAEDGKAPGRILQAPGRISSEGSLALLVLDYDDSGRTRLTGEAPPGAPLRIYVDNQPAAEAVTEPSGRWTAVLKHNLAPGEYTLRLDQLGSQGRAVARLETPFARVSQPPIAGKAQVDYVIVQPGNSLWRIARRLFGSGMAYTHIYDTNQAQIRNPDLIYPGQVFEVPGFVGFRSASRVAD